MLGSMIRTRGLAAAATAAIGASALARADDTDVFFVDPLDVMARPNVLFILDNSLSMGDLVVPADAEAPTDPVRKIDVVKSALAGALDALDGVNVGLVVQNAEEGGHVRFALADVAASRAAFQSALEDVPLEALTPLSETLYEAYLYLSGGRVRFGDVGPQRSVDAARVAPGAPAYASPLVEGCQKSFVVYLSDGDPTADVGADADIERLAGTCDGDAGDGRCLDDLAAYMHEHDVAPAIAGDQTVATYTVGFGAHVPALEEAAADGGGAYFTVGDAESLADALAAILREVGRASALFAAPAVPVNAFNHTRHANDLYVGVFAPSANAHWPGNLKKYRLEASDGAILDAAGLPAVDASGSFAPGARSYWSAVADGATVTAGGAASRLPPPAARNVYTFVAGADLASADNAVAAGNALISDALLGTGVGATTREQVIAFMRGADLRTGAPRFEIGDPLHSRPAAVAYSESETVVYFGTNDGFLHAVDAADGTELWAFVPPELLDDQAALLANAPTAPRHYGIDGAPHVQTAGGETDGDERVYLFFGMRRGGDFYYGLDVTVPARPRVLWRLGPDELPGLGQSWSSPTPARIEVASSAQNEDALVLVFGAGYDPRHDDAELAGADTVGNGIFIVDSVTGAVLWHGAKSGGHRPAFAKMDYAIPADVRVIDLDGDGYADRMYAADLGGQVWKLDVWNGAPADALVTGGVIASLTPGLPAPSAADTHRFFYAPDAAFVPDDPPFIHIGIGSGHRELPNGELNMDRFYALRDTAALGRTPQAEYEALTPITEDDLLDVTGNPTAVIDANAYKGWRITLPSGEKVFGEARTFANQVLFTTFAPGSPSEAELASCVPARGTTRLYTLNVSNGAPVDGLDDSVEPEPPAVADRSRPIDGAIAGEVVFVFPSPEEDCSGEQCTPPAIACVGLSCFATDFRARPIRTYWSELGADEAPE